MHPNYYNYSNKTGLDLKKKIQKLKKLLNLKVQRKRSTVLECQKLL